jgi:nucleolar protein 58
LKKKLVKKGLGEETLGVMDHKLGALIKDKFSIPCVSNAGIHEVSRGIRSLLDQLLQEAIGQTSEEEHTIMNSMRLGLSHSLSRYKLKFSPDKVDTMIVQAIGLLDDLDKEINTYAMRLKEWFGWHFPELTHIVNDNLEYAKIVQILQRRRADNDEEMDAIRDRLMAALENNEELVKEVIDASKVSMGVELEDDDVNNLQIMANQVVDMMEYRIQLFNYLQNRMRSIAPQLSMMVGELVGARLISHSGSLVNLAKQPSSTIQILGAEKALFRALKAAKANKRSNATPKTPKYGLIYHASLIGQVSSAKNKGKISRLLASKTALAIRVDALSEETDDQGETEPYFALENRRKIEDRIRVLEGDKPFFSSSSSSSAPKTAKYAPQPTFNTANDVVEEPKEDGEADKKKKKKKRKREEEESNTVASEESGEKKKKKKKKKKSEASD